MHSNSISAKTALICGIGGQDGSYLAKSLLGKGYRVWGTSRDAQGSPMTNLKTLGILERVRLVSMMPDDFRSVFVAIERSSPDEIYYLAGQSSVGLSFDEPANTFQSLVIGTLNILEACRIQQARIRLYHAGSSECFGDTNGEAATETMPFRPRSPYAVAKSSSHWLVSNYREAYGLYACTGHMFNHESPLRPARFVTQKIVQAAKRIANGSIEKLSLGRLDITRDWGWAPEYVEAMWQMLQLQEPEDFVIATGTTRSLETFVRLAFEFVGLHWREHVIQSPEFTRPTDLLISAANPRKAQEKLHWHAKVTLPELVCRMMTDMME